MDAKLTPNQIEIDRSMSPHQILIYQNWAAGDRKTGLFSEISFISLLHETDTWNTDLFWGLDRAFFELRGDDLDLPLESNLLIAITDIFLYIYGRLARHRMPSDMSLIKGLSDEDCYQLAERMEGAFRVALYGAAFDNKDFERVNPLLA